MAAVAGTRVASHHGGWDMSEDRASAKAGKAAAAKVGATKTGASKPAVAKASTAKDAVVKNAAARDGAAKGEIKPYTAVVYVHGIGSQRRFEETSRLVDRLDKYLELHRNAPDTIGRLRGAVGRVEPHRSKPDGPPIGFIDTRLVKGLDEPRDKVRFYEIYWAPVMAEVTSLKEVGLWTFRQVSRPFKTVSSPWRERQRLRRAALVASLEGSSSPTRKEDLRDLAGLYNDFEDLPRQEKYRKGSFEEFLSFVSGECGADAAKLQRLTSLAKAWRALYVREERRNAFALVTLAIAILVMAIAVPVATKAALDFLTSQPIVAGVLSRLGLAESPNLKLVAGAVVSILGFLGIGKAVNDYLGDVLAWATYEETDAKNRARNAVLEEAQSVLGHVLADPSCQRVVLVAHSLGTTIAHDALLAMTRRNTAKDPQKRMSAVFDLAKIEHFVTLGSPIDKIEYFFESFVSQSHRYKRVVEDLRGDIGTPPFTDNRRPHIHWINFWDAGDPISGALQSPASATQFENRVDNIEVASLSFPDPAASHSAYFDHRFVIATLVETIFERKHSFRAAHEDLLAKTPKPTREQVDQSRQGVFLSAQESLPWRAAFVGLAGLAPWTALAGLIVWVGARALGVSSAVRIGGLFTVGLDTLLWAASGVALLVVLVARWLLPRWHRNPIRAPKPQVVAGA